MWLPPYCFVIASQIRGSAVNVVESDEACGQYFERDRKHVAARRTRAWIVHQVAPRAARFKRPLNQREQDCGSRSAQSANSTQFAAPARVRSPRPPELAARQKQHRPPSRRAVRVNFGIKNQAQPASNALTKSSKSVKSRKPSPLKSPDGSPPSNANTKSSKSVKSMKPSPLKSARHVSLP
jgi:hypothetical protein